MEVIKYIREFVSSEIRIKSLLFITVVALVISVPLSIHLSNQEQQDNNNETFVNDDRNETGEFKNEIYRTTVHADNAEDAMKNCAIKLKDRFTPEDEIVCGLMYWAPGSVSYKIVDDTIVEVITPPRYSCWCRAS